MEPPQLIKEELVEKLREFLKKPENVGFVAGFSLTIIVGFLFISKLYSKTSNNPKNAAHAYVGSSKKRKKGIIATVRDSSLEYGMVFFLTLIKDYIVKYLEKLNDNIGEHKEAIKGE